MHRGRFYRLRKCVGATHAALEAAGVTKMFSDTMSGARDDRPGLAALLDYVRPGDTVVVWKLDRLGRNMIHILQTVKELTDQGITRSSSFRTRDGVEGLGENKGVDDTEEKK